MGITGQGRSLKVVMMRTALAVLGAAQTIYAREGGKKNKKNPADPYMTLLGYFNSLRELGGSRRIMEDEVRALTGSLQEGPMSLTISAHAVRQLVGPESSAVFACLQQLANDGMALRYEGCCWRP